MLKCLVSSRSPLPIVWRLQERKSAFAAMHLCTQDCRISDGHRLHRARSFCTKSKQLPTTIKQVVLWRQSKQYCKDQISGITAAQGRQLSAISDGVFAMATEEAEDADGRSAYAPDIPAYCSGCGVKLQNESSDLPGFFQLPKKLKDSQQASESVAENDEVEIEPVPMRSTSGEAMPDSYPSTSGREEADPGDDELWDIYNSIFEESETWEDKGKRTSLDLGAGEDTEDDAPQILCARCYSLQHYGRVKSQKAEASLPAFELGKKVGRKIAFQKFRRPVILCVVDIADFDGSLPRSALRSLLPRSMWDRTRGHHRAGEQPKQNPEWNSDRKGGREETRLVLVANKADLLPTQATKLRLETWIRKRVQQAELPRPESVHLVSSTKLHGILDLLKDLDKLSGISGDVWVVGAQNAGKSSLINAMRRTVGKTSRKKDVTTAALPGTTLGLLRIDGILGRRQRMFDTPGVPHQHQLSSRLSADEVRLLLPRGKLKPRSFRVAPGQAVYVGGVLRLDAVSSTSGSLYFTVWASADIPCHFGKIEGADERYQNMAGSALTPPLGGSGRAQELGQLLPADIQVAGSSFKASSTDVAVAGLGWVGVALSGNALLRAWTHEGVAATVREALIPDIGLTLEKPGLGNKTRAPPRPAKRK